ncbi:unnamed protein product [Mytilus coruscus]|uniref:Uncharacterized protein n=1 Tax=Mytilus coruscus TaxID=42192 RepID=A0A6J8AWC3_MYTCO|nr:unnamed protein product [Mytilus coruscus]
MADTARWQIQHDNRYSTMIDTARWQIQHDGRYSPMADTARCLEVLKQNVSQDIFVSMVKSKLPEEVPLQLEIQKGSQEKWTVMSLCDKLRDYVVAREKSDKKETPKERSNGASNGASNRAFNGGLNFRPKNKPWQTKYSRHQNGNRNGQLVNSAEALVATTDSKSKEYSGNVTEECVNGIDLDAYSDEGCGVVHENVFISSSEMWAWKEENYELPVNRDLAMGRLKTCVARMRNKLELMIQYNSVIQDQLTKGIIELVDEKRVDGTPQKSTTKLRIVYDASAKMNKDVNSLNECLYHGPVMLRNLCATIESHLNKYNTPTAEQIRNNIYVNNLITGANTVTDALTHYSESKQIFEDASMNLREWISNSQSVNDFLLPEDKPKVNQPKVLGHLWNIENDTLSVKHSQSFINSGNITKRKTLMEIS